MAGDMTDWGKAFHHALANALGLPGEARSLELRVAVGEVVQVRYAYYPDAAACARLLYLLQTYDLGLCKDWSMVSDRPIEGPSSCSTT